MDSSSPSSATPKLPVEPLRPTNSNTSSASGAGFVSPLGGPSPTILKDPVIIDIDPKSLQQPSLAVAFGSQPKTASQSSREGLRRQVERRRMTLTVPERNFLDHLCVHGNEVEVQLAHERLADEDLFFDWQTPRHLKASENQAPEEAGSFAFPEDEEEEEDCHHNQEEFPKPAMKRVVSVGSQRRLQILEDRKTHKSALWQAHESGIAVTNKASKKSIFKRSNSAVSILSNGSAAPPQMIRDSSRFSFASTNTGSSGGGGGENQLQAHPQSMDIFRRVPENANKIKAASPLRKARYQRSQSLTGALMGIPPPRGFGAQQQQQQRRSSVSSRKSVTFSSQTKRRASSSSVKLRRSNSDGIALNKQLDDPSTTLGRPPRPPMAQRSESMASIPSIHHATPLRQDSVSSIPSIHHANLIRGDSTASSIPPIPPAHPLRSNSISSIPSIRHGHPLRSNSISSIPSIRHGNAVRSPSTASIASIRQANPLRSGSIGSIPSIHHANAIRGESMSSIPSIHHANAVRGESSTTIFPNQLQILTNSDVVSGTFPTGMIDLEALDHSLMDDDDPLSPGSSIASRKKVLDHQNSLLVNAPKLEENGQQQQLLPTYSATPDIATAWLNQQVGHFQSKPFDLQSQNSFPPAIQIPSTITDKTEPTLSTKEGSSSLDEQQQQQAAAAFVVNKKAVLVRRASRNSQYDGEGMEVTEMDEYENMQAAAAIMWPSNMSIRQCTSFDDETMSLYSTRQNNFDEVFRRSIRRTFSDEEVVAANMMVGNGPNIMFREISNMTLSKRDGGPYGHDSELEDEASWDMQSQSGEGGRYDSWNILKDEYVNGYGGGGSLDFAILGTCADDISAAPHVLSPPMMESLAAFLPYAQSSENFFLRYSLVRDGASMLTFLKRSRGVQYGILALETVDGEVFGCFTGQPWRKSPNYFGTGESFLWRMRRSRLEVTSDILEQAQLESEIDVYPHTGENQYYQLCTHDRIAVGGGTPSDGEKKTCEPPINPHEWGFGLDIQGDLLVGSSSPCATFDSPSLSKVHADGSLFEIVNLELWTLTPCTNVQDAERLELGKLFLERQ